MLKIFTFDYYLYTLENIVECQLIVGIMFKYLFKRFFFKTLVNRRQWQHYNIVCQAYKIILICFYVSTQAVL